MTLAAREEEACLASMKIASPIFRNYEGSTCIVRSKSTIRKGRVTSLEQFSVVEFSGE